MNDDFRDLLASLLDAGVRFLVVGAHALAVHAVPRATGDLDIWLASDPDNAERAWSALERFGAPLESLGVSRTDLATPGMVVQIGLPPRRLDLMTRLSGVDFETAWGNRVVHAVDQLEVPFLGRAALIANKRATGRPQDLADLARLTAGESIE